MSRRSRLKILIGRNFKKNISELNIYQLTTNNINKIFQFKRKEFRFKEMHSCNANKIFMGCVLHFDILHIRTVNIGHTIEV